MTTMAAGPFEWWATHSDLMVLCLFMSVMAAGIVIFLKNVRGSSILVALLSSVLFTSLGVPSLSIEFGWRWPNLMIASALMGFGSLTLALTAIKVSEILQRRAVDGAATWNGSGKLPGTTVPPPTPGGGDKPTA